jgi:ABC-type phosphate/phosphonate transport system substrate-binding protein
VPTFAHDANLRFPVEDPVWAALFDRHEVVPASYDDMGKLGEDLTAAVAEVAFLPAGNFFYLRDRPYRPLANALGAPDGARELASLLIAREDTGAERLEQLRGARRAYTHEFCTTSYFATALLLHEHGDSIADFFELVPGYAFESQVEAVLDGTAAATMVQEGVWRADAAAQARTREIGRRAGLPGPLVIVGETASEELRGELERTLFEHGLPGHALFTGFARYRRQLVERFCEDSAAALAG